MAILDEQGQSLHPGRFRRDRGFQPVPVALGYWKRGSVPRHLSAVRTIAAIATSLTGDLGCLLPDGSLIHQGRRDFQVKIRGFRVELPAVELALSRIEV
ncbi:MAG: hypothetical protein IPJ33_15855 [Gammaproteobacteria bacterium]|nr:hypothetical protein [Gammaproteobacteria bacterium]